MQVAKIGSLFNNSYPIPPIHHSCKNEGGVNCNLRMRASVTLLNQPLTFSSFAKEEGWMPHHHLRSLHGSPDPLGMCRVKLCMCIFRYYIKIGVHISVTFLVQGWRQLLWLVFFRPPLRSLPWKALSRGRRRGSQQPSSFSPHRRTLSSLVTHSLFLPLNNKSGSLTNSPTTEAFFCHHLISWRCDLNVSIHTGSRMASRVAVARLAALRRIASPALSSKRAIDTSFYSRYSLQGLAEQNWQ